ncbi:serine/threonine-protein kinase [Pseudoxanthomonas sp.]|uniref:serine/threonine-protein kinase n=1 Tax=Pseudoxanthomonas sp. TaxID=1871049 RepID=UPI00262C8E13|nr:serine/threonine-protein kinase [Pseudoxanthomonas sp.]WDS37083.1 MAG: protein kinase [Pseudoxanthomonas sp.]
MSDKRALYERAKAIAIAVSQLPAQDRANHFAAECAGDAELREEAEWLLAAIEAETAAGLPPLVLHDADASVDRSGQRIAAGGSDYRILRRLGEGGMGTVWLAERRMDGATQHVALKLLNARAGQDPLAMRRFAEERRILAALDHPNIARLIDAGTMADGQPYLAMEYVQGQRIDVWCRERELPLERRMDLFTRVCAAVQYAHQHLVVHRDIKPANILVDARGEPKLLDFGIARLLQEDGAEPAMQTAADQRMLTLAYASPEQVRGESLTTASDIWSLGAVLYELACGEHPFGAADSLLAMSNAIVTGRLLPPSRRRTAGQAPGRSADYRIPADVDAIVMKAMRTQKADRYATAAEMERDLQRFLESRPVEARRGALWYRARLYLKRHGAQVAVAVLVIGLLSAFWIERERQLHRVERERDTAQALAGFMSGLFENADPVRKRGERITVAEVLDKGVADLDADRGMSAPVRASLMLAIGRAYNALDRGDKALPVLERARALQASDTADVLERGRMLAALGRAHSMVVGLESAASIDAEAIALLQQAPGASEDEILRVRINRLYSEIAVRQMPLDRIRSELSQILATLRAAPTPDRELEVQALAALSMAQASGGDDAGAIARADEALALATQLYGADNDAGLLYYRFVRALVSIRTDPNGAVERYRATIATYDRAYGKSGPGLAGLLAFFGDALIQIGHPADAEQALRRALSISSTFAAIAPDFHLSTQLSLVESLLDQDRLDDAAGLVDAAMPQLDERARAGASWAVGNRLQALNLQADLAARRGQARQAAKRYSEIDGELARRPPTELTDLRASVLSGMGQAQLVDGQDAAARAALTRLDALNRQVHAPVYATGAIDAVWLEAALAAKRGDAATAARLAAPAAAIAEQRWGADNRRSRALLALAGSRAVLSQSAAR